MLPYNPDLSRAISLALTLLEIEATQSSLPDPPEDWPADIRRAARDLRAFHRSLEASRPTPQLADPGCRRVLWKIAGTPQQRPGSVEEWTGRPGRLRLPTSSRRGAK